MNWAHRMTDTVTYSAQSSINRYGNVTFAANATLKAFVYKKRALAEGQGDVAIFSMAFASETKIPIGTRVWMPGVSTSDETMALHVVSREEQYLLDGSYTFYVYDVT